MGSPHAVNSAAQRIVLFDGVCNLCNSSVQFIIKRDPTASIRFAALQSEVGQALLRKYNLDQHHLYSVILIDNDRAYTRSDAALGIARYLNGGWPILYSFRIFPRFIRDFFYNLIAKNRYRIFGKQDACMIPTPSLKARFVG